MAGAKIKTKKKVKRIFDDASVKVTETKHIIQIVEVTRKIDVLSKIHKIDKYTYYTDFPEDYGKIFEYKLNENRGQNIAGTKKTFKRLRNLINNNFTGGKNELMTTLTYAENMTDDKKLLVDFDRFWKRFRRIYPNTDYLSVIEPQARGAWHIHVLMRFNDCKTIFIDNNTVMAPLWGHGWTETRRIDNVDNVGAYLSAYLADLEISQENVREIMMANKIREAETVENEDGETVVIGGEHSKLKYIEHKVDGENKQFIKGGRLHMYPSGINIYRRSRGIKMPETLEMPYSDAKKLTGERKPVYAKTIDITDAEGKIINRVTYENYNMKRGKKDAKRKDKKNHK